MVKEDWILEGDFNAIMDDAEKVGGRRELRVHMKELREVLEELALVDIKTARGWFTWVNNRDGNDLVKERLDRFVMTTNAVSIFPFIETNVIRQTKSDHDAVMLDTLGRKPKEKQKDPRLFFKFDAC
ncbi:reverse transcriptase [Gossypium australe]|uniref:Reverse transcriptase n=1 Tax=Gossypium australe TaxID=47621 RepID=A0A5B6UU64_9ROSI|nr:reverse transcriptase [Gossypium australe]